MKKYSIFMAVAATLAFASCQNSSSTDSAATNQAQMDSVAKATEEQARAAQQAANDSLIQAEAKHVADSTHMADSMAAAEKAAAEKKGTKHTATPKTPKATPTPKATEPATPKSGNDRPGANQTAAPKNGNDRPGANK